MWKHHGWLLGQGYFYLYNFAAGGGAGPYLLDLQVKSLGGDWVTHTTITNQPHLVWSAQAIHLDFYDAVQLRFFRDASMFHDLSWLGLDDITITPPPAMVSINDHWLDPVEPRVGDTVTFGADLDVLGGASNLIVQVDWDSAGASGSFTLSYDDDTGLHEAIFPNGTPPLEWIYYTITATFDGHGDLSPQVQSGRFFLREALPVSQYDHFRLEGDLALDLALAGDHDWLGVKDVTSPGPLAVYFESQQGTTTTRWSDSDPEIRAALPVYGILQEDDPADITIQDTSEGWLAIQYNEVENRYSLQQAHYQSFDTWGSVDHFGQHFIEGWELYVGRVTDDPDLVFEGHSIQFVATTQERALVSPVLSDGIGTIMFRYRNTSDTLEPAAFFYVQARAGIDNDWVTLATASDVRTPEYAFMRVLVDDPEMTQMRIYVPNGASPAQLLLDDMILTAPGPHVILGDLVHSPPNPTVRDTVEVSVEVEPMLGAEMDQVVLWFRCETSNVYYPVPMTNATENTYVGTIPRGPVGAMQYYVAARYFDPLNGTYRTALEPIDRTGLPVSYTNTDALLDTQNFDDFPESTTPLINPGTVRTNGWTIHEVHVFSGVLPPISGQYIALFPDQAFSGVSGSNSYVQTSLLSNGVGTVSFHLRNFVDASGMGPFACELQISSDGGNWDKVEIFDNSGETGWIPYAATLNIYEPVYLRFFRDGSATDDLSWLAIDDIQITYPSAQIAARSFDMHSPYPTAFEPVSIHAVIESDTTYHPAFNIQGTVEYRIKPHGSEWGEWEHTVVMERYPNGLFIGEIPGYPDLTSVEYRIRADFKGYHDGLPGSDQSPMIFIDEVFQYRVRAYESAYERIDLLVNGEPGPTFVQQGEGLWEGFVRFTEPVSSPDILLAGTGFYDGGTVDGTTHIWGDNSQGGSRLPLMGTAIAGGAPITIPGDDVEGLFLVRFDEQTGAYSLQRVAFQDFESWPADAYLFDESYDGVAYTVHQQDFVSWPLSDPKIAFDTFEEGWPAGEAYPDSWNITSETATDGTNVHYVIRGGIVIEQPIGQAALLAPGIAAHVRNGAHSIADVGRFSFDVRCASPNDFRPTIYDQMTNTNIRIDAHIMATDIPTNSTLDSMGFAYKSVIGNYIDDQNYYEARVTQVGVNQKRYELWKKTDGTFIRLRTSTVRPGNITTPEVLTMAFYWNSPSSVRILILRSNSSVFPIFTDNVALPPASAFGVNGMDASLAVDHVAVSAVTNTMFATDPIPIYSENFVDVPQGWSDSGGRWTVSEGLYTRPGYTGEPLTARVQFLDAGLDWTTIATITNLTHSHYERYTIYPHRAKDGYIRVLYDGVNSGEYMIIDHVERSAWRGETVEVDGWTAVNVWVDDNGVQNNAIEMRHSRVLDGASQKIVSPALDAGAVGISFQYRPAPDAAGPVAFVIEYEHRDATDVWHTATAYTNISSESDWQFFSYVVEDRSLRPEISRVRIRNITPGHNDGIIFDAIILTEQPQITDMIWWGYNALITDVRPEGLNDSLDPWLYPQADNMFGAFLNNSYIEDTGGITNDLFDPFIQSARMPDGIGEIRFQYRGWDENPSNLEIVASTNRFAPEEEWLLLDSLAIHGTEWQEYRAYFYDQTNHYVVFRMNLSNGEVGRVGLDNILITSPLASDLRLREVRTIPEIPLYTDAVHVEVEVDELFLDPTNIHLQLLYAIGTNDWGNFSDGDWLVRGMELIEDRGTSLVYRTSEGGAIPAQAIDEVVQYQVRASFDGLHTAFTSPKYYEDFETPDHYWPVDLNRGQSYKNPHYYSLSSIPGQVWINELNIADDGSGGLETQFVELVGWGRAQMGNWRMDILETDFSTNTTYAFGADAEIGPSVDAYNFYVFGQSAITNRTRDLTAALPLSGGMQLVRGMGAIEQQISYDSIGSTGGEAMMISPDRRFVYAGMDTGAEGASLLLTGRGSNRTDFVWSSGTNEGFTIGVANPDQTLIPWPTDDPIGRYTGTAEILTASIEGDRVYMTIETTSETLHPVPWYATNVTGTVVWHPAPESAFTVDGTTYVVSCGAITNAPMVFYRVTVSHDR